MENTTYTNYVYYEYKNLKLSASIFKAVKNKKDKSIIYIHGGGLLYGSRNDLPEKYIKLFLESGYDLITLDYPLAPEAKLAEILGCLVEGIKWFKKNAETTLHLPSSEYFLFGRSAGAFLCLLLTAKYNFQPIGIISFYGYYELTNRAFSVPNQYYSSFSAVPKKMIDRLLYPTPVAEAPLQKRYMLYVYCRQQGTWLDSFVTSPYEKIKFSLNNEALFKLPPVFLTASRNDTDVPFTVSLHMSEHIQNTVLEAVDGNVHDFDRNINNEVGMNIYQKVINWLNQFS